MLAFRCKSCGHLHHAEHAGEADRPAACAVCGAGVRFSPQGIKSLDPDNWEVLADATPERLEDLGLEPKHIARPKSKVPPAASGKHVKRETREGTATTDKAG